MENRLGWHMAAILLQTKTIIACSKYCIFQAKVFQDNASFANIKYQQLLIGLLEIYT